VLGALEAVNCKWDFGPLANLTFGLASGVHFKVDGSAKPEQNTIAAPLPLSVDYVAKNSNALLSHVTVTLTPSFKTDRAFDREVWDTTLALTWLEAAPVARRRCGSGVAAESRVPSASDSLLVRLRRHGG
jgi:hypothetical protein